jgi:hypothetical protein
LIFSPTCSNIKASFVCIFKNTFCDTGYTEVKGSKIKNKPEAEAIVNKIENIIQDDIFQRIMINNMV